MSQAERNYTTDQLLKLPVTTLLSEPPTCSARDARSYGLTADDIEVVGIAETILALRAEYRSLSEQARDTAEAPYVPIGQLIDFCRASWRTACLDSLYAAGKVLEVVEDIANTNEREDSILARGPVSALIRVALARARETSADAMRDLHEQRPEADENGARRARIG
jgi:hypothetical protein